MTPINMTLPGVVSRNEWLVARKELLTKEKELTRHRDRVNADRRSDSPFLAWVRHHDRYGDETEGSESSRSAR